MSNLFTHFESITGHYGDSLAIEFRPRFRTHRWTYHELADRVRSLHAVLVEEDVAPGDRVLLHAGSSPYWVAAYYAILGRGAVVVPLNPKSAAAQLDRIVASAEPKLVLASARQPWTAAPLPAIVIERAAHKEIGVMPMPGRDRQADDLCEIIYTSGTTGDPKGVMLTHANLLANIEMLRRAVPVTSADRVLSILPLFHMYAQMISMLYPLSMGCAVTYLPAPSSRLILETLKYTPATYLVAVPEFLKTVMDRVDARLARVPSLLRPLMMKSIRTRISKTLHTVVSGGAALDPEVERKWRQLGFEILQGYGLTETSPVITTNTREHHRLGSVGKPCTGVALRISADGEILVRGPNVMAGYFRDEMRTRACFENGWFKTDDGGRLDADGFLYVSGRRKYMILGPSGENVFPEDVEIELNKIPGVRDSAVFGLEQNGRTLLHAVLLGDDCDGDAVIAEANRHLAPHQQIMSWSIWPTPDFPRSATRKPKKEEIMAWVKDRKRPTHIATGDVTPLVRVLAQVTHHEPADIHAATRIVGDLGVDSLLRIELVSAIEEELNVAIDETFITPQTTVADLESRIAMRSGSAPALTRYPRWPLSAWANVLRPLVRGVLLESWLPLLCRLSVRGAGHLDGLEAPVIFMANHDSFLDSPVAILALPQRFRQRLAIAAATEVLYKKFRWIAPLADLAFNSYPLPTGSMENIKTGLEYTGRLLDDGWNVLIYPEGQMNRSEASLQPLKGGAGMLGVEMQVPVVPMAIIGTKRILPPDAFWPRGRGVVSVCFGPPLRMDVTANHMEAAQAIEAALSAMLTVEEHSESGSAPTLPITMKPD